MPYSSSSRPTQRRFASKRSKLVLPAVLPTCLASAMAFAQSDSAAPPVAATTGSSSNQSTEVQSIVVTGSSIRGSAAPVGSSLVTLGTEQIRQIGVANTADLLARVPQLDSFAGVPVPVLGGSTGAGTAPSMRGLSAGATLVLLNGHRLVGDSPLSALPDPSAIPPAAISRIEVVPDGASAIYGSDAVAGVINIITRKDLDGFEANARYGHSQWGRDQRDFSLSAGTTSASGSAMLTYGFSKADSLSNARLPFYREDFRPYGSTDLRSTSCPNPNITIGGTVYAPPDYSPGQPAHCDNTRYRDALPQTERHSLLGSFQRELTDKLTLWGDLKYSYNKQRSTDFAGDASVTIPSSNPYFFLPPGASGTSEDLALNLLNITGPLSITSNAKAGDLAVGVDYELPARWALTAYVNLGRSTSIADGPSFDAAALAAAAAGTTPATALDPFGFRTNPSVAAAIANYYNEFAATQTLRDLSVKADGPLFRMAGGSVKLAVGLNQRTMDYDARNSVGALGGHQGEASISASRRDNSEFAELYVPVVGKDNALPGVRSLELTAAVRHDSYSDFGASTNPKFGFNWRPVEDLNLRGSVGKSFHAPDMGDSYAVDTRAIYFPLFPLVPPGSPMMPAIVLAGGNTSLKPETARSRSFGFDFAPESVKGLALSATYYNIRYKQQIQTPPISFDLFTNPSFSGFYTLNPSAAYLNQIANNFRVIGATPPLSAGIVLDLRRQNLSATETSGIDFQGRYAWKTSAGNFGVMLAGNRVTKLAIQSDPSAPFAPREDQSKLRMRAGLDWSLGDYAAGVAENYLGGFKSAYTTTAGATAEQSVAAFYTTDLRFNVKLPSAGWTDKMTLSINVNNLFNRQPPLVLSSSGVVTGYSDSADPSGRTLWLGLQKQW